MRHFVIVLSLLAINLPSALAHDEDSPHGHGQPAKQLPWEARDHAVENHPDQDPTRAQDAPRGVTGTGRYTFRHFPLEIPQEMAKHIRGAHGGFARDPESRGGDGSTYFSLKNVGLLKLKADLSEIQVIGGNSAITGVNLHKLLLYLCTVPFDSTTIDC